MTPHEIRQMSEAELFQRLEELQEEVYNLRFQKATRQFANSSRMQAMRRDVARIQTILREHHLGIRSLSVVEAQPSGAAVERGDQA